MASPPVFESIDFIFGDRKLAPADGSWSVYYNFDQYLYETEKGSGRGVGLFARFGASDGDPNLMQYFYSAGVGGKGFFSSRPHDQPVVAISQRR